MSTLKNRVQLIGNVGEDPMITTLENGKVVAQFSLATNDNYKNSKGEKQSETDWHSIVAWGKVALIIDKYVGEGDKIAIEGKLKQRFYETKEGEKRSYTEVIANEILFMGSNNSNTSTE
jgi:single-strand DNA-binding protein